MTAVEGSWNVMFAHPVFRALSVVVTRQLPKLQLWVQFP